MNSILQGHINNSESITEHYNNSYHNSSLLPNTSGYVDEAQSASVTSNGSLWQKRLAQLSNENASTRSFHDLDELKQNILQSQKNRALIQLLRSWREGDEQEQKSTLEYLKQAIDEDRTSDRKIFP